MSKQFSVVMIASFLLVSLNAQSLPFEKTLGSLTVRVTSTAGEPQLNVVSASGTAVASLPPLIDGIRDAAAWADQRLIIVGRVGPLTAFSLFDLASGQITDNLLANIKASRSPDNRRLAFDKGRSLAQPQSAVVLLYDVSRSPSLNRASDADSSPDGFSGAGLPVYPDWNRIHQSVKTSPEGEPPHSLKSQLTWINNETLVFFDYSNGALTAVLVQATDVSQPVVRKATVNVEPLITELGKKDFADGPLARLPLVDTISALSIGQNLVRIKVNLHPAYWLTASEFEIEF